jgi:hypothetical protein
MKGIILSANCVGASSMNVLFKNRININFRKGALHFDK